MTDLTEYTWYYCKMKDSDIRMLERGLDYFLSGDVPLLNNEVKEVLAPVPSYEELQNINKSVNDLMTANIKLVEENTKLKELLKEVQSKIRYSSPLGIETFADLDDTLLGKINQALGEDK